VELGVKRGKRPRIVCSVDWALTQTKRESIGSRLGSTTGAARLRLGREDDLAVGLALQNLPVRAKLFGLNMSFTDFLMPSKKISAGDGDSEGVRSGAVLSLLLDFSDFFGDDLDAVLLESMKEDACVAMSYPWCRKPDAESTTPLFSTLITLPERLAVLTRWAVL